MGLLQIQMRDISGFQETRLKILTLRPNQKIHWLTYALSLHVGGNPEGAVGILNSYMDTLDEQTSPDEFTRNFENSELAMYKNLCLSETKNGIVHDVDEGEDKKKEEEQALADFEEKLFQDSQALGSAVIDLIGKETKVGKGLALAQIAADTARALSGALANANSPTPDNVASGGLAGIAKYIALATTIATNAKRAIDIVKSENVSGAASGSAPTTGGGFTGSLNAPAVRLPRTEEFTGDRRIYVTEYDISNTQEKVKVTEDVSIVK